MYRKAKPLFLFCETPLHVGTGSDLGIIDLPIQRERHTGFPKIESSSVKGSLREAFERNHNQHPVSGAGYQELVHRTFGFDGSNEHELTKEGNFFAEKKSREFTGCISVTDARLILFPVKSQTGVFAWITCPRVANRFINEIREYCPEIDTTALDYVSENTTGMKSTVRLGNGEVALEEYVFPGIDESKKVEQLGAFLAGNLFNNPEDYWAAKLSKDIVVLTDDDFADFVQFSTEVITRNKIDNETGTVTDTALFTIEFLPSESLLYSLVMFAPEFRKNGLTQDDVTKFFNLNQPAVFQIGGNASLGKGIVRTKSTKTKS
jgi:CRISPR-associated protein Cmr4